MNGEESYGGSPIGRGVVRILIAVVVAAVAMAVVSIKGCRTGPFGRKQVVTMSPDQQQALGLQAYREVLSKARVITRGPIVDEVKEVTNRLVRARTNPEFRRLTKIPADNYQWDVRVVESKEVNAFCLPGGKMVVYTAILPVCKTNAGLATVMGHEICHALCEHGAERMAQQRIAQIGAIAASGTLGDMDPGERARVMAVINAGAQFGILRYSRKHESEADHAGLLLMAAAGYDPRESVKFWTRMSKMSGGGKTPEFLSTHPSHETRIRDLERWMPEAMPLYEASDQAEQEDLTLR